MKLETIVKCLVLGNVQDNVLTVTIHLPALKKTFLHAEYGQRHLILSPIGAHYKWPQNKIYSHVFVTLKDP